MSTDWPDALWLVRHGESIGNAASARAWAEGRETIDVAERDADVDLTERGEEQARTLGRYLASLPVSERPTHALVSPYLRARHTARLALDPLGGTDAVGWHIDERLRDRELGVLDRLTAKGIEVRHPAEAAARARLGKFYHRPAGGESWADVLLRLRGVLTTLRADHAGQRVVIFAHDIVVLLFRYLIEDLDEQRVLAIARDTAVINCGVTHYDRDGDGDLVLRRYNAVIGADGKVATTSA